MNAKNIEIYHNNQLVRNRSIYNTHDGNDNEYQNIPNLIEAFGGTSNSILMFDYHCSDSITIPYHWHDWTEFVYLFNGRMDVFIENNKYTIEKNSFFYFPSGVMHKTVNYKDAHVLVIHLKKEYLKKRIPIWGEYSVDIAKLMNPKKNKVKAKISDSINELYNIYNTNSEFATIGYQGLLDYILYKLIDSFGLKQTKHYPVTEKYKKRLLKIFDYVDSNLSEKIELNDLAMHLGVTPQYLSKLFRIYLDITFTEYINEKRLEKAERDIVYTDLSLLEIALKFGFSNYQSFLQTFKNKYNITPSEFRKKHQLKKD